MKKGVYIDSSYITLGQLLKAEAIIDTGGQAKWYLRENAVEVNDENENRRGRKLYPGDNVYVHDEGMFFIRNK